MKSDSLVLPQDAFILGSKSVSLSGLDLLDSTGTTLNPFKPYQPEDLTLSLVAMALKMSKVS